jgi:hypothetical protein
MCTHTYVTPADLNTSRELAAYGKLAQMLLLALRKWYTYRSRIGSMLNNIYASKVTGPTGLRSYFAM